MPLLNLVQPLNGQLEDQHVLAVCVHLPHELIHVVDVGRGRVERDVAMHGRTRVEPDWPSRRRRRSAR